MRPLPQHLVRAGFYLFYNQFAFTYDWVAWLVSFGQWADWRRTALPYLQPGPILELSYGTGGLFVDMRQADLNPVGIDLSPFMARITAKKLQQYQLAGDILRAKAQALPFSDGYFRNIIATFPTNYIFEAETLAEIYRLLPVGPDGGVFIIVLQGQLKEAGWLKTAVEWLYRATGQRATIVADPTDLLNEAGFTVRWETGHYGTAKALLLVAQKQ